MLDIAGAQAAAAKVAGSAMLENMLLDPTVYAQKASWNAAISGAYSLLSPLIHKDFPSRDEVIDYVFSALHDAFRLHHTANYHSQYQYSVGGGMTLVLKDMNLKTMFTFPLQTPLMKMGRPVEVPTINLTAGGDNDPDISIGIPQMESIIADPGAASFQLLNI